MVAVLRRRGSGLPGTLGISRVFAIGTTVLVALALQSTLLARLTVLGVIPQLTLVVIVAFAYLDGERVGVVIGFCGGLLLDLLIPQSVVGLHALVYTLIGYAVGALAQYAPTESVWLPVTSVALATAAAEFSYAGLSIILGQPWVSIEVTAKLAGLVVLYNTLLTPLTFPLLKKIADKFRPERVFRG
ncbi:MAG: rod shape-determining protein MreD [Actinomycetota bacterium]|nr:rod shape-determining protein MreD [Actinomycetota bacterium]